LRRHAWADSENAHEHAISHYNAEGKTLTCRAPKISAGAAPRSPEDAGGRGQRL